MRDYAVQEATITGMTAMNDSNFFKEAENHPEIVQAIYTSLTKGTVGVVAIVHDLASGPEALDDIDAIKGAEAAQRAGQDLKAYFKNYYQSLPRGKVRMAAMQLIRQIQAGEFGDSPMCELRKKVRQEDVFLSAMKGALNNLKNNRGK